MVRDGLRVVEDSELEIFIFFRHIRDLYEGASPVYTSGLELILEVLVTTNRRLTTENFTWGSFSHRDLFFSKPSREMRR